MVRDWECWWERLVGEMVRERRERVRERREWWERGCEGEGEERDGDGEYIKRSCL